MTLPRRRPALFLSLPQTCTYLPGRESTLLFADPVTGVDTATYGALLERGFRRSGTLIYRPRCAGCSACIAVRVPVAGFRPDRAQRRAWARNRDLTVTAVPATFRQEHFDLYCRYQQGRHPGSSMDDPDQDHYRQCMLEGCVDTLLYEFRARPVTDSDEGALLAVAVVDRVPDALSAVYTFYDPTAATRSLGTLAVLWQIELARRLELRWVYLGYWIASSPKMRYKDRFRPIERLAETAWVLSPRARSGTIPPPPQPFPES